MVDVSTLSRSDGLTFSDLEALRELVGDDGRRYELIDGAIIVTPSPVTRHQVGVGNLHLLLRQACPDDLYVLMAPYDVVLSELTVVEPDLLVARRSDLAEKNLPVPPLLAVEVLSPSTRRIDLGLKREKYAEAGCAAYWVLDPQDTSFTAWERTADDFVERVRVLGDDEWTSELPLSVTVSPRRLLEL